MLRTRTKLLWQMTSTNPNLTTFKQGTQHCTFLEFKKKSVIILATVAIYVCFESAENTPNMNIKLFFVDIKKNFHSHSGSVSLSDGTMFKSQAAQAHVMNILRSRNTWWIYYKTETRCEYITKSQKYKSLYGNATTAIYLSGIWDKNDSLCSHVVFIAAPVLLRLVLKRISRVWSFNVYYISIHTFIFKAAHLLTVSFIRSSINSIKMVHLP